MLYHITGLISGGIIAFNSESREFSFCKSSKFKKILKNTFLISLSGEELSKFTPLIAQEKITTFKVKVCVYYLFL